MTQNRVATPANTPWFIRNLMNPIFKATGAFPIVSVRGRRTGKVFRTPINLLEVSGARYLLSPRGETGWSRNLRAVGECTLKVKGHEQRYRATEVPPSERPPLFAAYLQKWPQPRAEFDKKPDPVDHPTFRLEPL